MTDTVKRLLRHVELTNLIGRLILLADEGDEFDSMMKRINARLDYFEENLKGCLDNAKERSTPVSIKDFLLGKDKRLRDSASSEGI